MEQTTDKYERICTMWEDLGLQNMCAKDAASKLGVSPTTLVIALKTRRPGAYNPNKFKGRKPRVYIYQNCRFCGSATSIRIDISTVDEAENKKIGKTSIYICKHCLLKQADLIK